MKLGLQRLEVGPWPMNCYLVRSLPSGPLALVDPGQDSEEILAAVGRAQISCILLTHAHPDHTGALDAIRQVSRAPVGVHPADAEAFHVKADFPLLDGAEVEVGEAGLSVAHVPGHTAGSVCFRLNGKALVGDAIFPGGPGHTSSPEALAQSLSTLAETIFTWPDDTELYPGHGVSTTVGAERSAFERFMAAERYAGLFGDVSWR